MISLPDNLVERSVLDVLARRSALTVAYLAKELSIPATTTVGAVTRLYDRGLLCRRERGPRQRGRPRYQYALRLPRPLATFQFDGTELAGCLFDENQAALAKAILHVPAVKSPDDAAALMGELLGSLLRESSLRLEDLGGVAVCLNAIRVRNKMFTSSVLPWVDDTTQRIFTHMLGLPVRLISVPHLAAELQQLDQAADSVAYLHVGDGVSGHFCAQGKPYNGATERAGELGHIIADPQGPRCGCGRKGCLESFTSGPAIAQQVRIAAKTDNTRAWLQRVVAQRSARAIIELVWQGWQDGDEVALELMEPVLNRLGWGLGLLVNILDPQLVVIGGYVLQHHKAWQEQVTARARPWILHGDSWQARVLPAKASTEDLLRVITTRHAFNSFQPEHA